MLKLKTSYSTETGELTVRFPKRVRDLVEQEGTISFTVEGEIVDAGNYTIDAYATKATAQSIPETN